MCEHHFIFSPYALLIKVTMKEDLCLHNLNFLDPNIKEKRLKKSAG